MALTAYCKKCGREVEPGEICSRCGTRLGRNAAHAAWCVERTPVKDWMYWNSVMRLLLPAALAILLLVLVRLWFMHRKLNKKIDLLEDYEEVLIRHGLLVDGELVEKDLVELNHEK